MESYPYDIATCIFFNLKIYRAFYGNRNFHISLKARIIINSSLELPTLFTCGANTYHESLFL